MIYAKLDLLADLPAAPAAVREAARLLLKAIDDAGPAGLATGRAKLGDLDLIVMEPETAASGELPFETHRRFIDLQVVLEGAEGFECARPRDCVVTKRYDADAEAELYASAAAGAHFLELEAGDAVVFFLEDAHKPRIAAASSADRLRKAVVKIPAESAGRPGDASATGSGRS